MSSEAYISFEPDTVGVPPDEWKQFCDKHSIVHSPNTVGGNVYYAGDVEVSYKQHGVRFSTYWRGKAVPEVARLAMLAWRRWGGRIAADPEVVAAATTGAALKE